MIYKEHSACYLTDLICFGLGIGAAAISTKWPNKKKKKKWFGLFLSKYLTNVGAQLDSGRHEISRKLSFPFLFLSDIVSFFQTTVLKVLSLSKNLTKPEHMLSHGAICVVTV